MAPPAIGYRPTPGEPDAAGPWTAAEQVWARLDGILSEAVKTEFSTGTVKVGQTEDPRRRLPTHRAEAAAFGVAVTNYWISPAHPHHRHNETRLINRCLEVSARARREYFHDVTFDTAVGFASELTCHSTPRGAM